MFFIKQRTVKKEIDIKGIGLHSGEFVSIKLKPAPANVGIKFIKNNIVVPANIEFAKSFEFSTTLENKGEKIQTVEHLMAALYFLGIDNIYIEIDGDEMPILDGSAEEFIKHIKKIGVKILKEDKIYAVLTKEIILSEEDKYIYATPSEEIIITYEAKYNNNIIGNKKFSFKPFSQDFKEISQARTYCFFEEVEYLKQIGLAKGGSLENAVVFKDESVLNPDGLRFEDEPVRHKVLDLIGDLYLLGYPLIADIYSVKGGHALNASFVKKLIDENTFKLIKASDISKQYLNIQVA